MNQTIGSDTTGYKEALSFLLTNQQQIHENIKFADQKALVFLGIDSALIAFVFNMAQGPGFEWFYLGLAVCCILLAGIFFSLLVVKPRGARGKARGEGLIDANRICLYRTDTPFREECDRATPQELLRQTQSFIYDRATIDRDKYRNLRWTIWVSATGGVCALLFTAFFGRHPKPYETAKPELSHASMVPAVTAEFSIRYSNNDPKGAKGQTLLLNEKTGDLWRLVVDKNGRTMFVPVPIEGKASK